MMYWAQLDVIQRAEVILEKDLFQIVSRGIRNEYGDKVAAILAPSKDGYQIEFTRSGWRNPLGEIRSTLQRVAYALEGNELIRYYWLMLDRSQEPVRVRQVVLSGVLGMKFRFMDEKKQWKTSWPPSVNNEVGGQPLNKNQIMPLALEITLKHETMGSIASMFPLMTYKASQTKANGRDPIPVDRTGERKTGRESQPFQREERGRRW